MAKKAFNDGFYSDSVSGRFMTLPTSTTVERSICLLTVLFHQNRFPEALAKFEEILKSPLNAGIKDAVLYWIAEVHFRGNAFAKAANYYKMVIDEFPQSFYAPMAYYSLGWSLFQEGKYKDALAYFRIIEQKFPDSPQVHDYAFKIIECLYNLKDYTNLKETVSGYLKQYAQDPVKTGYLNFYLAESDYYLNDYSEAIAQYNKVLMYSKDEKLIALSQLGIGWSYLKLKDYKKAEEIFASIKIEHLEQRSREVLLLGKAILLFEIDKFEDARAAYQDLSSLSSDPLIVIQAYLGMADALYSKGF